MEYITGECQAHGFFKYVKLPFAINCCPKCMNERAIEYEKRLEADSKIQITKPVNLEKLGVLEKHFNSTFDNFIAESIYQQEALKEVKAIATGENKFLVLCGGNGCGKTHLVSALIKSFGCGLIVKMKKASLMIRNPQPLSELQMMEKFEKLPLLVIDEIGRSNNSEFEQNWLSEVIDERWGNNKPTVLICNYPLREMVGQSYQGFCMDDVFGSDVLSRLKDFKRIRISGKDMRGINNSLF